MSDYRFPATVDKIALSTKKMKDEGGDSYEVPHVVVTLTYTDPRAASIAAKLAAYQGIEVTVELDGNGRQLNLV